MDNKFSEYLQYLADGLGIYFDIDFIIWLLWLWKPFIIIIIVLPATIVLILYINACIIRLYKLRHYHNVRDLIMSDKDIYDKARAAIALTWDCHGWIWHGYEVVGMDKIPKLGPAMIVYYHGVIPVDYYYLNSRTYLYTKRLMRTIAADFLFKTPGLKQLMDVLNASPGTVEQVSKLLLDGEIVSVAPGGIREAQFSSEYYELVWNNRLGFAKAACLGKAPIIPVFTQNIREAYRTSPFFRGFFRWIYEKTKLPFLPIYGGFPVKLRTYIGTPIPYDPSATPEEVAEKTASAIEKLISAHQQVPGSVVKAILQRFNYFDKPKKCHPR